jgi:hypothetical protein
MRKQAADENHGANPAAGAGDARHAAEYPRSWRRRRLVSLP